MCFCGLRKYVFHMHRSQSNVDQAMGTLQHSLLPDIGSNRSGRSLIFCASPWIFIQVNKASNLSPPPWGTALFRAGLLKVKTKSWSPPSTYFRYVSDEALEMYFFGKLGLTLPKIQHPWLYGNNSKENFLKNKWKKNWIFLTRKIWFFNYFY